MTHPPNATGSEHAVLLARVEEDGPVVAGAKGLYRPNPLLAALNAVEVEIRQWSQQIGLSPASRSVLGYTQVRSVSELDRMAARRRA